MNPQASAKRNVLHDIKKKSAVSSRGKQCSLVNLVTSAPVKELSPATSIKVTENHSLLDQDPSPKGYSFHFNSSFGAPKLLHGFEYKENEASPVEWRFLRAGSPGIRRILFNRHTVSVADDEKGSGNGGNGHTTPVDAPNSTELHI